ncbi:MAG: phosphomannomutase/phosphoglucomutase [Christensenellaceae bacterium]|jgi:phosphomannomutase
MDLQKLRNESDIRGIASEGIAGQEVNLTDEAVYRLAAGFFAWVQNRVQKNEIKIGVGRDSRISGPRVLEGIKKAAMDMGVALYDTGLASTPAMFMSTITDGYLYDGAIMITASHLPFNRNGMKFFVKEGGLESSDIKEVIAIAEKEAYAKGTGGNVTEIDFMKVYSNILVDKIKEATGMEMPLQGTKIVVDAGNGAGGFFAADVLAPLGADVSASQFLEPDGMFPNHIPNPEDKEAGESISKAVLAANADLGIIFDTDVDRAGVVDPKGRVINRNRLIALIGKIILEEHPKTTIVTDSTTSSGLAKFIQESGGIHHRFKRGYKNVINEAVRLNEVGEDTWLAIETSGHAALKENYFLDDGAYLVTKILITMANMRKENKDMFTLIETLEEPVEAEEFRINIKADDFGAYGKDVIAKISKLAEEDPRFTPAPVNHEGIRVSLDKEDGNGWFLVRMSLHDPLLPINVESDEVGGLKKIVALLYEVLQQFDALDLTPIEAYLGK